MEYGKAFTFVSEDENWVTKLLIGGVMAFLGGLIIPTFILWGYSLEIMANVIGGNTRPLPQWDLFEDKLRKGLNVFVIRFVYALPLVLFACCYALVQIALASAATSSAQSSSSSSGASAMGGVAGILGLCFVCFAVIYGIIMSLAADAALINFVSTGQLNSAFKFREVLAFTQKHVAELFMVALVTVVASIVGGIASLITCGIGYPFVAAWIEYAHGHMLGQLYQKAGLPAPPAPSMPSAMPISPSMPPA